MGAKQTNSALQAALDSMPLPPGEPFPGETLIADGWVYRDVPSWFTKQYLEEFLVLLGEGNYRLLAASSRIMEGERYYHGQFLLSPAAIENLRAHNGRPRS